MLVDEITKNEDSGTSAGSPIDLARAFIQNAVQMPALASSLPQEFKSKIKHSDFWLEKFSRVGDLLLYLKRFDVSHNDPVYRELKKHSLLTFEDIVGEFSEKFELWAQDCSRISDFVVGERYSVYDILILARNYDTRAGGMFVLEANNKPVAVIIKATLSNGRYANTWIEQGEQLKYYLKSISGVFGEHFKPNKAILDNKSIPIVTFTRDSDIAPFVFRGVFHYESLIYEENDRKAFILHKNAHSDSRIVTDSGYAQRTLEKNVNQSIASSQNERLRRLASARKLPTTYLVTTTAYSRNADVIAEVLNQAKGICQGCNNPAPFLRRINGVPYLEVHHRVPLAMGGEDTVENAIALCPNCHRERHFGASSADHAGRSHVRQSIKQTVHGDAEEDLLEAITVKIR
jgi:5-methylcytosine-specific restriction protein A